MMFLRTLLPCTIMLYTVHASAQCAAQVTHSSGTQAVAGINVTVEPIWVAGFWWDCGIANAVGPYLCGGTEDDGSGSWTFTFSPPAPQLMIGFSAIHTSATYEEVMRLFVNGAHYAIPTASTQVNACNDLLAVLNVDGDVVAGGAGNYGWHGTILPGPISTLTVRDSVAFGSPGGAFCSLYVCTDATTVDAEDGAAFTLSPNPASDHVRLNVHAPIEDITITDVRGRQLPLRILPNSSGIDLDVSTFPEGVYFLSIPGATGRILQKLLIERAD